MARVILQRHEEEKVKIPLIRTVSLLFTEKASER